MTYKIVTDATSEPVTLEEARLQCNLLPDDSTEWDGHLVDWIKTAREYAEHYSGRSLVARTLEMALDAFPQCAGPIELDMPPVTSVTSVKYDDTAGVEQTLSTAAWRFSAYGQAPRRITCAYGYYWPATRCQSDAVRIRYVVGASCPKAAKSAMLLMIGHLYENRQEVLAGDGRYAIVQLTLGAAALLDTVKVYG